MARRKLPAGYVARESALTDWVALGYDADVARRVLLMLSRSFRWSETDGLRLRILQPVLPIDIPYRLIPQAEIDAEGARLAAKYPGIWNRRPEQTDYASVSAVGFNPTKTKAVVHVSVDMSGEYLGMELRDGTWVEARRGCGWII
jgi:hypothetical protein